MAADALLLAITGWSPQAWDERFRALAPERDIRMWPMRMGEAKDVAYACAWKPPAGLLAGFPNLKAIFSLGAGVDHLLGDPKLPDVPVVRIVDDDLTMRMTEYVVLHVLMYHRRQRVYDAQQRQRLWKDLGDPPARDVTVGVMGLGVMGGGAIAALRQIGFGIVGWSRTPRTVAGAETFSGAEGLEPFLTRSEILVCLLPHTPDTDEILSLPLLRKLKRDGPLGGAYLINAGRGRLQVDADILAALDEGTLAGATLDVFPTEPLPKDSPLWSHSKVTVTPHNAAASDPRAIVRNVLAQVERMEQGLPLENVVDRKAGY
jgi:glyoxylate/hydroxypyruvate reductase A